MIGGPFRAGDRGAGGHAQSVGSGPGLGWVRSDEGKPPACGGRRSRSKVRRQTSFLRSRGYPKRPVSPMPEGTGPQTRAGKPSAARTSRAGTRATIIEAMERRGFQLSVTGMLASSPRSR